VPLAAIYAVVDLWSGGVHLLGAACTFLGIVIAAISIFTFAAVVWVFIRAAKKDGEEDRAVQRRLGIRRRTRLGR
jgi:hypothetical protein